MKSEKVCVKCKNVKEITCFNNDKSTEDGKQKWCINCKQEYNREHHLAKREYYKEYHKKWLNSPRSETDKTQEEKYTQDLDTRHVRQLLNLVEYYLIWMSLSSLN